MANTLLAKLAFITSGTLLVGAGIAFATGSQERRSDLAGSPLRIERPALDRPRDLPSLASVTQLVSSSEQPGTSVVTGSALRSASSIPATLPQPLTADPIRLSIPSLSIDAPIVPVGIQPDKSMEIPGAVEAGWYRLGATPGATKGSAVLAGHVDRSGRRGVFFDLRKLNIGSEVTVEDADGKQHHYIVSERFQTDKDELPSSELFRTDGPPTLTLITCGGRYRTNQRTYDDNIVVRAQLVT
jgi:LPXTG-site transpeptidase (sortase) family protein